MARRYLSDIFNGRSFRRALAVTVASAALFASPFMTAPLAQTDVPASTISTATDPCPPTDAAQPDENYEQQLFRINDPSPPKRSWI